MNTRKILFGMLVCVFVSSMAISCSPNNTSEDNLYEQNIDKTRIKVPQNGIDKTRIKVPQNGIDKTRIKVPQNG